MITTTIITKTNKFFNNNLVKNNSKKLKKLVLKQKNILSKLFNINSFGLFKIKKGQLELFDIDFTKNLCKKKTVIKRKAQKKVENKQLELFS